MNNKNNKKLVSSLRWSRAVRRSSCSTWAQASASIPMAHILKSPLYSDFTCKSTRALTFENVSDIKWGSGSQQQSVTAAHMSKSFLYNVSIVNVLRR
jgi:hypothetical protein